MASRLYPPLFLVLFALVLLLLRPPATHSAISGPSLIGAPLGAGPVIVVQPESLTVEQPPDSVITKTLTIGNNGSDTLTWTISEERSATGPLDGNARGGACQPQPLPWASADPVEGQTPSGTVSPIVVTFDSSGLLPGEVTGVLCIASNAPQFPIFRVPLILRVLGPTATPTATATRPASPTATPTQSQPTATATATPDSPLIVPPFPFGRGRGRIHLHNALDTVRFFAPPVGYSYAQPPNLPPNSKPDAAARHFLTKYGSLFGLEGGAATQNQLELKRQRILERGRSMVRFQQVERGIPVLGAELIVQMDSAHSVLFIQGEILPDLTSLNLSPALSAGDAALLAVESVARSYALPSVHLVADAGTLAIHDPRIFGGPEPRFATLVWRFEVTAPVADPSIRQFILVDAQAGSIVVSFNQNADARNRETHDTANSTILPGGLVCNEANTNCTGGDMHEVAAHVYAGTTYDFYAAEHGRDSIDDAGMTLRSTVHYGTGYANAFWNSTQMVYGDAYGFPLAEDVVGHELTHGVTEHESGLFYFYQSGAINESFSDIWGEFVDQETNSTGIPTTGGALNDNDAPAVRWLMGESITGLGAIRNMQDPTLSSPPQPDRMTSPHYYCQQSQLGGGGDNGGVHYNSGVGNKAAYLLTDGGTFNSYTVTGLGYAKTADLFYEVQRNGLTSASDYADLCTSLQQACVTLGYTAAECQEVQDAVNAVEMCQQPIACAAADAPVCPAMTYPSNLFADDIEAGSGNWTIGSIVGIPYWYVPQTTTMLGLPGPYATSGVGNIWSYSPGTTSDTFLAMNSTTILPANAYLHYQQSFGFESDPGGFYDGGVVEYSTNNGATWNDAGPLFDTNGYNGTISNLYGNPLGGRQGFVSDSRGYRSSRLTLNSLAGQGVRFRFRIGTDNFNHDFGWFVDDVRMYTCVATNTICNASTIQSNGSGAWNNPATWNPVRLPNATDIVRINAGHTVTGNAGATALRSLCNYGTLQSQPTSDLEINALDFIHNEGKIAGADGTNGTGPSPMSYTLAQPGRSLKLTSVSFTNTATGDIQAGRGGHDQTYLWFTNQLIHAKGGPGGKVEIYGSSLVNSGRIGPNLNPSPLGIPSLTVDGGNGGVADQFQSSSVANNGHAMGGNGGATIFQGTASVLNTSTGHICSGNGGYANPRNSSYTGIAGTGGSVVFSAPSTTNNGYICAGNNGGVMIEPSIAVTGGDARIEGAANAAIFGGEGWTLTLSALGPDAISVTNAITLATGAGGVLDLRGLDGPVLNAGESVALFSDHILLDAGTTLDDLITAPTITTGTAQIFYDLHLLAPAQLDGEPGETVLLPLTLLNNSAQGDVFLLESAITESWGIGAVDELFAVPALGRRTILLPITIPSVPATNATLTLTLTSLSDGSRRSSATVEVIVYRQTGAALYLPLILR